MGDDGVEDVKRGESEVDECSVCRNGLTDPSTMSDCTHVFCFECIVGWLTKGSGLFCPMCKAPVHFVRRVETAETVTVEQILAKREPEATASGDLITEKRIVSIKMRSCRRMMNRIDEIIGSSPRDSNATKQARLEELNTMKRLCVSQLNSLQMLRDDIDHGAAKALVVSKLAFRRLVYERHVTFDGTVEDRPCPTRRDFLADIEHYRTVLRGFLEVELKAIPVKNQPRIDKENNWHFYTLTDSLNGAEEEIINRLFDAITEKGIRHLTPNDIDAIFNGLVTVRAVSCLLEELKSLISSKKTFLEWCGSVKYRSRNDRGGEVADGDPVVIVDDTTDDNEELNDYARRWRSHPSFRQVPITAPLRNTQQTLTNFLSDNSSSSDTDRDDDNIYFQGALQIPMNTYGLQPCNPAVSVIPRAGISWNDLTSAESRPRPTHNSSRNVPIVDLDDDENSNENPEEELEDEEDENEIQVVEPVVTHLNNSTIVLDDSLDSRPGPSNGRKRKSDNQERVDRKRQRADKTPAGLVDDVRKLIEKYGLDRLNALNMMVDATQEAMTRMRDSGNSEVPKDAESNDLTFSEFLSSRGIGPWSDNAPTKSIDN